MTELMQALTAFGTPTLIFVASVYFASAVFSGLSGFGFSAIGALTLCVLPPQFGVCMLMLLSLVTQALSLGSLRHEARAHRRGWQQGFLPYAAGGVLGLPLGLKILAAAPSHELIFALGALLVGYASYGIFKPTSPAQPSRTTSLGGAVAVGAIGGVVGGFSAFPGSALVVWNGLRNVPKEQGRALTQPFILAMQLIAISLLAWRQPSVFDARMLTLLIVALPLACAGNSLGVKLYKRTSHVNYRLITLAALGLAGASLVLKASLFF